MLRLQIKKARFKFPSNEALRKRWCLLLNCEKPSSKSSYVCEVGYSQNVNLQSIWILIEEHVLGLILEPDLKVKNIEPPKATFTQSNNLKISGTNLKMCKFQNLIKVKVKKSNFYHFWS